MWGITRYFVGHFDGELMETLQVSWVLILTLLGNYLSDSVHTGMFRLTDQDGMITLQNGQVQLCGSVCIRAETNTSSLVRQQQIPAAPQVDKSHPSRPAETSLLCFGRSTLEHARHGVLAGELE